MSKTKPAAAPVPDTTPAPRHDPFAHLNDPHWGRGGRYTVDPATGRREPVPAEAAEPAPKE